MPDQLAILIDFPDAMEGNLAYCAVGPGELEEKMVARNELDILQRNLDDFPAYAIMVANHEVARRKGVIPANPVKQVLDWNHDLRCCHPFLIFPA